MEMCSDEKKKWIIKIWQINISFFPVTHVFCALNNCVFWVFKPFIKREEKVSLSWDLVAGQQIGKHHPIQKGKTNTTNVSSSSIIAAYDW